MSTETEVSRIARYSDAIQWIALNDGAADTEGLGYSEALEVASQQVSAAMVSDVFGVEQEQVGRDILKARGIKPQSTAP